jgi:hypothetical protein
MPDPRNNPGRDTRPHGRFSPRNAALINLLVCPGMGSLLAGRIIAGLCQMALAGVGFVLLMVWFVRVMIRYYGLMFGQGSDSDHISFFMAIVGAALFIISWMWALITSLALVREASNQARQQLESPDTAERR